MHVIFRKLSSLSQAILLLTLVSPSPAHAATASFSFTAEITQLDIIGDVSGFPDVSGLSVSDAFTGSFSYDLGQPDTDGSPNIGNYVAGPFDLILNLPNSTPTVTQSNFTNSFVDVRNDQGLFASDRFVISGRDVFDPPAGQIQTVDDITIQLDDLSGLAFGSDSLPAVLNLADFGPSFVTMQYSRCVATGGFPSCDPIIGFLSFRAQLTSIEALSAVPLPATLPLFAGGLGLLGLFGWWRRRRASEAV